MILNKMGGIWYIILMDIALPLYKCNDVFGTKHIVHFLSVMMYSVSKILYF